MELKIPNETGLDRDNLIIFLISKIQSYITNNLKRGELNRWDDYLSTAKINWGKLSKIPGTRDVILGAAYNLTYRKLPYKYSIIIDEKATIPNTNIKYEKMIHLINYGNLSINGYDIFDKAFSNIIDNFPVYINEFDMSG